MKRGIIFSGKFFSIVGILSIIFWLCSASLLTYKSKNIQNQYYTNNYPYFSNTFQLSNQYKFICYCIIILGLFLFINQLVIGYVSMFIGFLMLSISKTHLIDYQNNKVYKGLSFFEYPIGKSVVYNSKDSVEIVKQDNIYYLVLLIDNESYCIYNGASEIDIEEKKNIVLSVFNQS